MIKPEHVIACHMTNISKRTPRLYLAARLSANGLAELSHNQTHYIRNVMRLAAGDNLRLFNGNDGEWLCRIEQLGKRKCIAGCLEQIRPAQILPDIDYLFAPLKTGRLDYMVQKATEMGARRIRPVFTEYTQQHRIKTDRIEANIIEAAQQCNLVCLPQMLAPVKLTDMLDNWDEGRHLVFCDERAAIKSPLKALSDLPDGPLALLIGPEGGFSNCERETLLAKPCVTAISLGPRIMRADTAAVAALCLLQAIKGDWPHD